MLANSVQGMVPTILLNPVSAANTAAATSAWVAVPVAWEGDVLVVETNNLVEQLDQRTTPHSDEALIVELA